MGGIHDINRKSHRGLTGVAATLALLAALGAACALLRPSPVSDADELRVMTFNIRYDEPADGANAWPHRKESAAAAIAVHGADIAGLQEALVSQIRDLEALLPGYAWVGVGRDDGKEAGEYSPIFYRKDRFRLVSTSTFWLSETPDRPGVKGWDAACPRVVTHARLEDGRTGRTIAAFNTHFDHVGLRAREESARLVLARIRGAAGEGSVVLTGDFNCTREAPPYRILVGEGGTPFLRDARALSRLAPYGPSSSFNGFGREAGPGILIDHIFVDASFDVLRWGVLPGRWEGRFVSDHNPVLAELRLARR
jgi:endonuclease/exonuclease/phosphatase family metal-dependent hydrolase